jgi:ribonuclease R
MAKKVKEDKLFQNLLRLTEQFVLGKGFSPMSRQELMERLTLPLEHRKVFEKVLSTLVDKNIIKCLKKQYHTVKSRVNTVSGLLRLHHRGFGFLRADNIELYPQDIFIPKHLTQNAVDGDLVEVEINPFTLSDKGPEGKVVTILKRGRTHLAGIVREIHYQGNAFVYAPLLGEEHTVVIQNHHTKLNVGDRIIMEVLEWGSKNSDTLCKMSHQLGHISDPSCDNIAAIEEYDLPSEFPSHVVEEAERFGTQVPKKEIQSRKDLRNLECFTIDPDTAKDFDDALSLSKDENGVYHLGVHIADVSYYVRPETAIDKEARTRSNSTYFPGFCLPMLPPALSENLCSLRPNVNRLTVSVLARIDSQGELLDYKIVRSVIKSNKRFTYKEAKLILDGKKKSSHASTLKLMEELCLLLKKKRYERGSIEFAIPELAVIVDEKGAPQKTDYIHYDISHQLVEEFMLKANEIVAFDLNKNGKNLPYRVHDTPSEENMRDFSTLAQAFGFALPEQPTSKELQNLFDEALSTSYGPFLASSYIRRMRIALYSPENIGHYGLGLSHYCHFTSPIRRYIDLIIHRLLFGTDIEYTSLEEISNLCSEQERISEKAENSVILLKKLRLLEKISKEEPHRQFEAVVTRVKNFGIFFEIPNLMLEGFFHLSELANDFYVFDEAKALLRGSYTGTAFHSGDQILVILKNIDLILRTTEWNLIKAQRKEKPSKIFKTPYKHKRKGARKK